MFTNSSSFKPSNIHQHLLTAITSSITYITYYYLITYYYFCCGDRWPFSHRTAHTLSTLELNLQILCGNTNLSLHYAANPDRFSTLMCPGQHSFGQNHIRIAFAQHRNHRHSFWQLVIHLWEQGRQFFFFFFTQHIILCYIVKSIFSKCFSFLCDWRWAY